MLRNSLYLIALFVFWPVLCRAGVEGTKHDLFLHDKEKNCTLCHSPHTDKSQPALWMTEDKPSIGDKTIFFTPATEEKVLCLSCHDGIFAKDICAVSGTEAKKPSFSDLNRYYSGGMLFFSTCEKHYYLVSYYRSQLPQQQLKCSICHDIHFAEGTRKISLISSDVYFKHKICLICHQTG